MEEEPEIERGGGSTDRHKLYLICGFAGLLAALLGIWLSPVSAEIGRREMTMLYHVGSFITAAGGVVTLACVVLMVVDPR